MRQELLPLLPVFFMRSSNGRATRIVPKGIRTPDPLISSTSPLTELHPLLQHVEILVAVAGDEYDHAVGRINKIALDQFS